MRVFNVLTDIAPGETVQFQVTARSINAAFNRAVRRVGQGRQIVVQDRDRVLSGMVPVESWTVYLAAPVLLSQPPAY